MSSSSQVLEKFAIIKVFQLLKEKIPEPKTELNYQSSYTLLVAVILSAQSSDKMVNKVTNDLFKIAYSPSTMILLGIEGLKNFIKPLGLYNTKAENIIKTSYILKDRYDNLVPQTLAELKKLPGIGIKSANVLLNTLFDKPTIAIDTHVFRVSNRIGICYSETIAKMQILLEKSIPNEFKKNAHNLLVLHGRYVCKARNPLCNECVVYQFCKWQQKGNKIKA